MSKTHRDNARARKKIGCLKHKKDKRRSKKGYIGPWTVRFKCGGSVFVSWATSEEISTVAVKLHGMGSCKLQWCRPLQFIQERENGISEERRGT